MMKSFLLVLSVIVVFSCQSEPKDCKGLIVQTWILKGHEVNMDVFKAKSSESLNSNQVAEINQSNAWQNLIDYFVTANDTLVFTSDGKYQHEGSETSYSISDDCQKMTFEMSPGFESEYTIHKLTGGKLEFDYIGITMKYSKLEK